MRWQFGVAAFLACGSPRRPPPGLRRPDSPAHASALERARESALNFLRLGIGHVPDLSSGRRGNTLVEQLEALRGEALKFGELGAGYGATAQVPRAIGTPVQPLIADRLALPTEARTFDLGSYLPPDVRRTYDDPEALRDWPPGRSPATPPCGLLPLSAQWLATLDRLDGCGLLALADVSEVPRGPLGEHLAASFFSTTKDADRDRTVVNRVRRNAQEKRLGLVSQVYPHGSSLCEIHLEPDEELRVSADDLPNYYHSCAITRARAVSNAVGRPVPLQRAQRWEAWARFESEHPEAAAQARARGVVQPLWNALPMGDGNAVDYAQLAHCNVLRRGGAMSDEHLVAYREPWPRGPTAEGAMVDDHGVLQVVRRGASKGAAARRVEQGAPARYEDEAILQRSARAYAAANLAPVPAKRVRFASRTELWGAHVDGRRGVVRSKLDVHWRALVLSLSLLSLGHASVGLWRAAMSLWVHVLLFRRAAFCVMQDCFRFGAPPGQPALDLDPRSVRPVLGRAASEVLSLVILSPFLESDLRARWASELVCTDASSFWGASVSARVAPAVTQELWRHRERRGGYVRVGDEWADLRATASMCTERDQLIVENAAALDEDRVEVPEPDVCAAPWVEELVEHLPWTQRLRYQYAGKAHINVKETQAYCADIRRVAADPAEHGTRRMVGLDSKVSTGASAKGRSSSVQLNAPLQKALGPQLFCGLYYGTNHIRTHVNPADAPTRGRRPRGFEGGPCPAWVGPLVSGDPSFFDAALRSSVPSRARRRGLLPTIDEEDHSPPPADTDGEARIPGPPKRARIRRPPVKLRVARISEAEQRHRARARGEFDTFLQERGSPFTVATLPSPEVAAGLLGDYGDELYAEGRPRSVYVRAVLAVVDVYRGWRRCLQEAWDVAAAWELREPGRNRVPLPRAGFEAGLAVALAWGWLYFATFLLIGWCTAGRPGELLALTRRCILLPSDFGDTDDVAVADVDEVAAVPDCAMARRV